MNFLKVARKEAGMTQAEVASKVGIKQPTYCNIENNERRPSVEMAKRIGEVLGFSWTQFYEYAPPEEEVERKRRIAHENKKILVGRR